MTAAPRPHPKPSSPRATPRGTAVLKALISQHGFRSAHDIHTALRADGQNISLSTVYRHIQSFAEQGLTDVICTPGGEITYRLCGPSTHLPHHHHLVCRHCGRAEEVHAHALEDWVDEVARTHSYSEVDHTIEVSGVCAACTD
jgi:Fur family transcriptional regulator, ferric uptake regulator